MSKREKIILAVMAVTILYGAYSFIFDSGSKSTLRRSAVKEVPIQQYVVEVITQLKQADASDVDGYLIQQAKGTLNRNPFYREPDKAEVTDAALAAAAAERERREKEQAIAGGRFSYTGYVEMGSTRLAILNGREFSEGEILNAEGMVLKKISPQAVVIGMPGISDTVTVDIQETN
jgi:hypothetical protein